MNGRQFEPKSHSSSVVRIKATTLANGAPRRNRQEQDVPFLLKILRSLARSEGAGGRGVSWAAELVRIEERTHRADIAAALRAELVD